MGLAELPECHSDGVDTCTMTKFGDGEREWVAESMQYDSYVVLRDGSTLHVRPVRPEDEARLGELHDRLSRESLYFRFFSIPKVNPAEVARLLNADQERRFVLVGESGGHISAVASYDRDDRAPDRAEVAFTIADALQGRGVGTRMLEMLADVARDHRIRTFEAYVLAENSRMMQVFLDSGFEVHRPRAAPSAWRSWTMSAS